MTGLPNSTECYCCGATYLHAARFCHICGQVRKERTGCINNEPQALDVEGFARLAAEHLGEDNCAVIVFKPWSEGGGPPPGILAPIECGDQARLNEDQILQVMQEGKNTIIAPCTFEEESEEVAAESILPQLANRNMSVFLVHVLTMGTDDDPSPEELAAINKHHDAMVAKRVDDVIMDPSTDPDELRATVAAVRSVCIRRNRCLQLTLDAEPKPMSKEAIELVEAQHQHLLWESIPTALMPHFPTLDTSLVDCDSGIGSYTFARRFEAVEGTVMHAVGKQTSMDYAIKVIEKKTIFVPGHLESIWREFHMLSHIIEHKNVARCLEVLHSPLKLYIVLEFAGDANLAQILSAQPRQHLDIDKALHTFQQIVAGLKHCHDKRIVHHVVSLEHFVLRLTPCGNWYHCRLVDFRNARKRVDAEKSRAVFGKLPCIAPEMALGDPHIPMLADCWSAGVVLLEMAGGLSSLSGSVPFDMMAEPRFVAGSIKTFFDVEGHHAVALSHMDHVCDASIVRILAKLLVPSPSSRHTMSDCMSA